MLNEENLMGEVKMNLDFNRILYKSLNFVNNSEILSLLQISIHR